MRLRACLRRPSQTGNAEHGPTDCQEAHAEHQQARGGPGGLSDTRRRQHRRAWLGSGSSQLRLDALLYRCQGLL